MKTGIAYTLLIFAAGLIFGLGFNSSFLKAAVKAAYQYGRESVLVEVLESGEIVEVASR